MLEARDDLALAEVDELEGPVVRLKQQVLWSDIPVYDGGGVDVGEGGEELDGVAAETALAVARALHQPVQQREPTHPR